MYLWMMKQISFLLVGGKLKPSTLFGAIEIFEIANQFLVEKGKPPYYEIQLVGEEFGQPMLNSFLSLGSLKHTSEIKKTDCIIIPAFQPEEEAITKYAAALTWVVEQYKNGAEVASLCSGAFLLAASGLLDDKPCSTHWRVEALFKKMFPKLLLATDKIVTDDQGTYTSGGAMSAFNLCLYLVEKYNGREAALYCTKLMQLDIERQTQAPFQIFMGLKKHTDEVIRDIQNFIEMNSHEKLTVDLLAAKCNMDRVNFRAGSKGQHNFLLWTISSR
jgi:transcriptional regulator GlxA family with amidase domain